MGSNCHEQHEDQATGMGEGRQKERVGATGSVSSEKIARAPGENGGQGIAGGYEFGRELHRSGWEPSRVTRPKLPRSLDRQLSLRLEKPNAVSSNSLPVVSPGVG